MNSGAKVFVAALLTTVAPLAPAGAAVEALEDTIEQKYAVDPDATLSMSNTDGAIRIYAAETSEIFIKATKRAYTAERLKGIAVDVQASGKSVVIGTTFPPRKNALSDRSGTVDYTVIVPQAINITELKLVNGEITLEGLRGGSARVHLTNGWVTGRDCFANLDLTVETGRLDVIYGWWENFKFSVKGSSATGIIRAILPSDASVTLNASSDTGRISNAFGPKETGSNDVIRSLNTVFGSNAEAVIELKAGRGDIQIHKSY
jgi:hypothetical protein